MIKNIEISKISPHYANPRKDLGDLTELADSIKKNGIFQNLTVVPWFSQTTGVGADDPKQQEEMGYIVVIGHRRLAAAKLAGLTKVPCEISKMSYNEQISTMLLENMQRCDLTVYEQAQGFQMLLDLGESVNNISKNTGFSETTVRRRVKLLDLDAEKFKKSVERGGTLLDYIELDKINDIDIKNKVLEKIGTPNFKWSVQNAIANEKSEKNKICIINKLKKIATERKDSKGLVYVESFSPCCGSKVPSTYNPEEHEYFYIITSYGAIELYIKDDEKLQAKTEAAQAAELIGKKYKENRKKLDKATQIAHRLRYEFAQRISNAAAIKNIDIITQTLLSNVIHENDIDLATFAKFFNVNAKEYKIEELDNEAEDEEIEKVAEKINAKAGQRLLAIAYLMMESSWCKNYNWQNEFVGNNQLNEVYTFLGKFGYKMSDEEIALQNGTHELFTKPDKEK